MTGAVPDWPLTTIVAVCCPACPKAIADRMSTANEPDAMERVIRIKPPLKPGLVIRNRNPTETDLLLPAAAQRLIERRVILQFLIPGLRQQQRRLEVLLLVVLHFQEGSVAPLIAHIGESHQVGVGVGLFLDLQSIFARLDIADEAVRDVAEGLLNRLLVLQLRLVALRPR